MQRFFNSSFGVSFGLALGRLTPPKLGYRLSALGARILARRKDSPMIKAVRANQFVVRGGTSTSEELDQAVEEVLIHAGRCFVDLYHNLQSPAGLKALTPLQPSLSTKLEPGLRSPTSISTSQHGSLAPTTPSSRKLQTMPKPTARSPRFSAPISRWRQGSPDASGLAAGARRTRFVPAA